MQRTAYLRLQSIYADGAKPDNGVQLLDVAGFPKNRLAYGLHDPPSQDASALLSWLPGRVARQCEWH